MNKLTALLLLAASLVPSAARANALDDLGRASGADMVPLKAQFAAMAQDSQKRAEQRLMIPRERKDIFASCSVIDAKTFRAYTLPEAVQTVQGCLDQAFAGRKYTVKATSGRFAARACPQAQGQLSCQAIVEVQGVIVTVDGAILTGDGVLADLDYSLSKRGGKLLGFAATLENKAAILK